tara:strand:+ start:8836 stop:9714 length:879 start_codon:yes stop_codon:yes gene_type:complete
MLDIQLIAQSLVSGVAVGCIYGLIGIGFSVIYNTSGIVNFAQGMFVMIGGMVTHFLYTNGVPLAIAAVGAIMLAALVGVAMERIVVRPLWDRGATMFVMILATLAVQIVMEHIALMLFGDQPRVLPGFTDAGPILIFGVAISYQIIWIVCVSLLVIVLLNGFFRKTRLGKAMRACAIDRETAALHGIKVSVMLALAFGISGGLGAIGGILVTPTQYTAFNVGISFSISGFIAAIVGGFGRPAGALLGGIFLGVAQALAIVTLGAGMKHIVTFSLLLLFLFLRPNGILGKRDS